MQDTIDIPATHPNGLGNMCRVVIPRPVQPPRPLLLRLGLALVWLRVYLIERYRRLVFVALRIAARRSPALLCRAVPSLTGGPDLLGWRSPVAVGMAFVAAEGEVSLVPQIDNHLALELGRRAKSCLSERERLGMRVATRFPTSTIRLNATGGWIISTADNLARLLGART